MAVICSSTRSRRCGGGRSSRRCRNGRFAAGWSRLLALMLLVTFNDLGAFRPVEKPGRVDRLTRLGQGGRRAVGVQRSNLTSVWGGIVTAINGYELRARAPPRRCSRARCCPACRSPRRRRPRRAPRAPAQRRRPRRRRRRSQRTITLAARRGLAADRARYGAVLHQAARRRRPIPTRRSIRRSRTCYATDLFADVSDQRRRDRRYRDPHPRESGDQPRHLRGQQAAEGRTRSTRRSSSRRARSSPAPRSRRRRADHRALSPPGPLRRDGRAEDGQPRPEPRRCGVRDQRGRRSPRSARSTSSATRCSPTASCAARWRPSRRASPRILSSNTSYDQDRLAYDQQKLRQFYLTEGYADFRVISAVAELTPDKQRLHHHLCGRGRPALQVRRRHRRQRDPRFRRQEAGRSAADQEGRLVQRQEGRGFGRQPERDRRPVRLRLRRREPGVQPRPRDADDGDQLPHRRSAARPMSSGSRSTATPRPRTR